METEHTRPGEQVYIANEEKFAETLERIKQDGPDRLHILADFDRTLTTAYVDGKPIPSMISMLRDGNYLTPDYAAQAHALYNHYAPIETDPTVPKTEKKKAMDEWWRTHFALLIKCGLTKSEVLKAIESGKIKFRSGVLEFLETLHQKNIPLIIMSSSAMGGEAIDLYLKKAGHYFDNINIISNSFIWNEAGTAVGVQEPVISGMNKDETLVKNFPFFNQIKDRPNVLLLGDSEGDIGMVEGFDYNNLIKIGFLNEKAEEHLPAYQKLYDLTITNDGSFTPVNNLLKQII